MSNNQEKNGENGAPAPNQTEQQNIFEIAEWAGVAMWTWDVQSDMCYICRSAIGDPCIKCQTKESDGDEPCTIAWGECNHAFHHHCIVRWLSKCNVCPMDNLEWKLKQIGR